ncbi:MAG: shikimate dehydrogenase [Pseudomonadota bacterium]
MTGLYGVLGDPIAQSLSPLIHRGWMRTLGLDAEYLAMQVPAGTFSDAMQTLTGRGAKGLNVTMPHKHAASAFAATRSETVSRIGAANTLSRMEDGAWHADNTDVPGFESDLARLGVGDLMGRPVTVIGAGGAARAVVFALDRAGASITLLNRTLDRAVQLLADLGIEGHKPRALDEGIPAPGPAGLVVNTASLGHDGDSLALPESEGGLVYDISYGPAAARVLGPAADQGWRTADGLGMLVGQAAESFRIWFGQQPDVDDALARCRHTVDAVS